MDVKLWAQDTQQARERYERWKSDPRVSEQKIPAEFIATLECHNAALEDHVIKLRRKIRRLRNAKSGADELQPDAGNEKL